MNELKQFDEKLLNRQKSEIKALNKVLDDILLGIDKSEIEKAKKGLETKIRLG